MKYAIFDIHGNYDLLCRLLEKVNFSASDTLYVGGDMIDKCEFSMKTASFLCNLPNANVIMGNHEYALLKDFHNMSSLDNVDYDKVLDTLRARYADGKYLDFDLLDFFENLPYYIEEENFILTHAGVPTDKNGRVLPLERGRAENFLYDRRFMEPNFKIYDSKCVLIGHTPTFYIANEPIILKYPRTENKNSPRLSDYYKIHADLGTHLTHTLGCVRLDDCREFYVRKS